MASFFEVEDRGSAKVLRLTSDDGSNRLTRACVVALTNKFLELAKQPRPVIITGNDHFFSAGADLNEIAQLTGPAAYDFAKLGQTLMNVIEEFPSPVCGAIHAYCMGGGLDLALSCRMRIAHPHAIFGHRGAALGLITGWGGTQRLPRLIGKSRALRMFVAAEKVMAAQALELGLISRVSEHPIADTIRILEKAAPVFA